MELVVVFFKQKTAYEMRISDWSSDVCSSDLSAKRLQDAGATALMIAANSMHKLAEEVGAAISIPLLHIVDETGEKMRADGVRRSEEHTSELQSLMRISYAVFCLKKKKNTTSSK